MKRRFYPFPMLYTKCIFHPRDVHDGVRISVMSRHTHNDGVSPDPRISSGSFDEWYRELAPAPSLVGAYYKRGLPWEAFRQEYLAFLRSPSVSLVVEALARRALEEDISLLCIEESALQCHRGILAKECLLYVPALQVIHR